MKIIVTFLLLFMSSTSLCQSWTHIGTQANGDEYYIKKHSNEVGSTKVWIKLISKSIEYYKKGKKYITSGSQLTLYDTDCSERKLDVRSIVTYNSKGVVLESHEKEDYESDWSSVVPDSVGEAFLEKACAIL